MGRKEYDCVVMATARNWLKSWEREWVTSCCLWWLISLQLLLRLVLVLHFDLDTDIEYVWHYSQDKTCVCQRSNVCWFSTFQRCLRFCCVCSLSNMSVYIFASVPFECYIICLPTNINKILLYGLISFKQTQQYLIQALVTMFLHDL